jgi:hypothetical protein
MSQQYTEPSVTRDSRHARQMRVADLLAESGYDGAIPAHRGQIFSLSGHWTRGIFQSLLFVSSEGDRVRSLCSFLPDF